MKTDWIYVDKCDFNDIQRVVDLNEVEVDGMCHSCFSVSIVPVRFYRVKRLGVQRY